MSLGLPIVAPDLPGTRAFLEPDCLFPKGNIEAAFKLVERLAEPTFRARVQARNRVVFREKASNESFAKAVRELTPQLQALGRSSRQRRSA
jgi:hypothetical protein